MGKIVAIGGGEIGRPGYNVETLKIDLEIKKMTGKISPKMCFIPTASNDSETYIETVQNHFGKSIGCEISIIELHNNDYSYADLEKIVFSSDIIYVGGGNTKMMLSKWKNTGLDRILIKAFNETNVVLSGISAGAICWFKFGSSDSEKFDNPDAELIGLPGLDLIDLTICPHFDVEEDRKPDFRKLLHTTNNTGIGLDNCCAVKIVNGNFQIITSIEDSFAWISKWENGNYKKWRLGDGASGSIEDLCKTPIKVL